MKNRLINSSRIVLLVISVVIFATVFANAQGTEFSYQGNLASGGSNANGNFDFEFALFDGLAGGSQIGATLTRGSVAVANGVFSVKLDFGFVFPSANPFLEIRVRQTGAGTFTSLAPRQLIGTSPYSLKSRFAEFAVTATNSLELGGLSPNQYVQTSDFRLTNERNPLPGSANYIRNSTSLQSASDFHITGIGQADIFQASTQFNIGSNRIIGIGGSSLFVGRSAGANTTGSRNIFVGDFAGFATLSANDNSFLGADSGRLNTIGGQNSFFGSNSGFKNSTGGGNSFFGYMVGSENTTGLRNTFVGSISGATNMTGNDITLLGRFADVGSGNLSFATAIGSGSKVFLSNTVVLGRGADNVSAPGIVTIGENTSRYGNLSINATSSNANLYMSGNSATKGINFGVDSTTTNHAKLFVSQYNGITYLDRLTINENGEVGINVLGQGGSTTLCRNALNHISNCSSSARYKSDIEYFAPGLWVIRRLRPVSFNWRDSGTPDLGLVAEEVAEVEPLLTTTVDGKTEGVKYDCVSVVLINAVQEQQAQIEELKAANERLLLSLQKQDNVIKGLLDIACKTDSDSSICKPRHEN